MNLSHPKYLSIHDFMYDLPESFIAKYPLEIRDQSKLLVYRNEKINTDQYCNLTEYLPKGSLLVFNNTKVVEARLLFEKESGGKIEIFCLEPADEYPDITTAMLQKGKVRWKCLVGGAKKWKGGSLKCMIGKDSTDLILLANKLLKEEEYFIIELSWNIAELTFAEVLHEAGQIPLPPYLNRAVETTDKERYQTIYALQDGSVAAPTAGLHFTESLFHKLDEKGVNRSFVTLHVGAGTFQPVKSDKMEDHDMHVEFIEVDRSFIESLIHQLSSDLPVIAVGTTSLRTIESLYWLGLKTMKDPKISNPALQVYQWDPYEKENEDHSSLDALKSLLSWMDHYAQEKLITKTQIIIAPGYSFRIINGLITNFHQPQSTLLLLVSAIVGSKWKEIYSYALKNDFRFLSYGDGSLLWL